MEKTIYKYPLEGNDVSIRMPSGAKILSVQVQNNIPCIWALVDPYAPEEIRHFRSFGTGHPIPSGADRIFIGTYQYDNGTYVFHCFELIKLP